MTSVVDFSDGESNDKSEGGIEVWVVTSFISVEQTCNRCFDKNSGSVKSRLRPIIQEANSVWRAKLGSISVSVDGTSHNLQTSF